MVDLGSSLSRRFVGNDPKLLIDETRRAIGSAVFTGNGDREKVQALLQEFYTIVDEGLRAASSAAEEAATEDDFACVVLDMAGACWVLPEFSSLDGVELICTFKKHLTRQLEAGPTGPTSEKHVDAESVLQELWGPGGPLSSMALQTTERSKVMGAQPGGLIEGALQDITKSVAIAFLVPLYDEKCRAIAEAKTYQPPDALRAVVGSALESHSSWLLDVLSRRNLTTMFQHSLALDCERSVWDDAACKPLLALVEQLRESLRTGTPTWLADYCPLRMYQHGDLNCGNLLVDVQSKLWLM